MNVCLVCIPITVFYGCLYASNIDYCFVARITAHIFSPRTNAIRRTLIHWGRVTHICVSKLTIIGSDNGLSPDQRQAIIWTNDGIVLIGPLGTNFSEISIEILTFSFKKMCLKVSSAKRRPFCIGLNEFKMQPTGFWWLLLKLRLVIDILYFVNSWWVHI